MPRFSGFAPPSQMIMWAWKTLCSVKRKLIQEAEMQRQFYKKRGGEILRAKGMAKGYWA